MSDGENVLDTSMTLRSAVITRRTVSECDEQLVDDSVCDCCQTDVAISASGPVAVYRNRTAEEIRDIYITRLVDSRLGGRRPAARGQLENRWLSC